MAEFGKSLQVTETTIPGLLVLDLPVHGDARGWFKENWQREKMLVLGLPDFGPVQNNISFNDEIGTTRGIHAEPWDKYVSVASGKIFGAWVDLREGNSFGAVYTTELDPSKAIFVPRGVANSYQTLEPDTAYTYLVNDHWSPDAEYTFLNLADDSVSIPWPIPLSEVTISEKDQAHPYLRDVKPMAVKKKTLVLGANGQLGRALKFVFTDAEFVTRAELDITNSTELENWPWHAYDTVINAAAFTSVDVAETDYGRRLAWKTNSESISFLSRASNEFRFTLVHISSDYVFDGTKSEPYTEEDDVSPLGVYAQSKAAGDLVASSATRHYIVRTSWLIGDGNNFVRTIEGIARGGVKPSVVNDQIGRLSFTQDLADGIRFLLENSAPFGTYNVTNTGNPVSWYDVAKAVFELTGHDVADVTGVSTEDYYRGKPGIAPRPLNSVLDISKVEAAGFVAESWQKRLEEYLAG